MPKNKTITIVKLAPHWGYVAYINGDSTRKEKASTVYEVVGKVIIMHGENYGITIEAVDQEDY